MQQHNGLKAFVIETIPFRKQVGTCDFSFINLYWILLCIFSSTDEFINALLTNLEKIKKHIEKQNSKPVSQTAATNS